MPEEFLHFIWMYQLFDHVDLISTSGEKIQVLNAGFINENSGPDFNNARIRIGETVWAGNVEIHVNTSDWYLHQHQFDTAYSNVILHVVYHDDSEKIKQDANRIPILALEERIDLTKFNDWEKLRKSTTWIPCGSHLKRVPSVVIKQMIASSATTRLQQKTDRIINYNSHLRGHWENTLMQAIIVSMGTKVNHDAFHALAMIIPFNLIKKIEDDLPLLESILFGIAGLLDNDFKEGYPRKLKSLFEFQDRKYHFTKLNPSSWKFMRMRPYNFPTMRIAQLAALFTNWTSLCNSIFYAKDIKQIEKEMRVETSVYWHSHYRFNSSTKIGTYKMGKSMFEHILINTIIPFLYAFGIKHDSEDYRELAFSLIEQIDPEKNKIIKNWNSLGIKANNAFESQGLIELKNSFCSFKKCLSCKIGVWILNTD
jgi:hypothetical protein